MLPKKQFNGAVARLRDIATTPDLMQMLAHQLTKANDNGKHNELLALLSKTAPQLEGTKLLDRRRAENYLANALYGRNHSQVAHLMPKDDPDAIQLTPLKDRLLHHLKEYLAVTHPYDSDVARVSLYSHMQEIGRQLKSATDTSCNFDISITGVANPRAVYSTYAYHVAVLFVTFLDIELRVELAYARDMGSSSIAELFESRVLIGDHDVKGYAEQLLQEKGIQTSADAVHNYFEELALDLVGRAAPELVGGHDVLSEAYPPSYIHRRYLRVSEPLDGRHAAAIHLLNWVGKALGGLATELAHNEEPTTTPEAIQSLQQFTRVNRELSSAELTYSGTEAIEQVLQLRRGGGRGEPLARPDVASTTSDELIKACFRLRSEFSGDVINITLWLNTAPSSGGSFIDQLADASLSVNGHMLRDYSRHRLFWQAFFLEFCHRIELVRASIAPEGA